MNILNLQTDDRRALISITFDDGTTHELAYARLRAACRCAECTVLQRRGGGIEASGVVLRTIEPIGSNALNLHFSDGHTRGIYPLPYLVELARS